MNHNTLRAGLQEARTLTAYRIMQRVYQEALLNGDTPEQINVAIRAAYPWGQRRAWPYKAWLLARREFYKKHGLPIKPLASIADAVQEGRA